MKKFFYLLAVLLSISCSKSEIIGTKLIPGFYFDECSVGDSLFFKMNCSIYRDTASLQFVKLKKTMIDTTRVYFHDESYLFRTDYVEVLSKEFVFDYPKFKVFLSKKREEKRDTSIFKIDGSMYCTWKFYDCLCNSVVKW